MSGRKRKKLSCPFSSSKKPKRWKLNGSEEFSVERPLRDRGSYYNQDKCAFCTSVFHLFAGSEHSEHWLARSACWPACFEFPFLASWVRRGVKLRNKIPILRTKSSASKKSQQFTYKPFQSFCTPIDNTATGFCARIVDVCLCQVVISHCCGKLTHADICLCRGDFNT